MSEKKGGDSPKNEDIGTGENPEATGGEGEATGLAAMTQTEYLSKPQFLEMGIGEVKRFYALKIVEEVNPEDDKDKRDFAYLKDENGVIFKTSAFNILEGLGELKLDETNSNPVEIVFSGKVSTKKAGRMVNKYTVTKLGVSTEAT